LNRRRPQGAAPPKLTPAQQGYAEEGYPIAVRLAQSYAARNSVGLTEADLLSVAHGALTDGAQTFDPTQNIHFESFIWIRIRGEIKDAIRKRAAELGQRSAERDSTLPQGLLRAAERALEDYAGGLEDPGDLFHDTHDDSVRQFEDLRDGAAAALAAGAAGGLWYMRGEEGFVLRQEYTRALTQLHEHMSALPSDYATILELRYFEQLTVDCIAQKLEMSKATADRRIADAIKLLRSRLSARGIREAPSIEGR
jgi:RNA polymerase sigma factor (sigma-70 family)